MSNTYKDKKFGYYNALMKKHGWCEAWDIYEFKPKYGTLYHWHYYCSNPSWYTREYMNRPARAKTTRLLKQINLDNCEDYFDFPNWKQPYLYYW